MAASPFLAITPLLPVRTMFTYRLPEGWLHPCPTPGALVRIPWHGQVQTGIVLRTDLPKPTFPVQEVIAPIVQLPPTLWSFGQWLTSYYDLSPGKVWRHLLPAHYYSRRPIVSRPKLKKELALAPHLDWEAVLHRLSRAPQQKRALTLWHSLLNAGGEWVPYAALIKAGATTHAVRALRTKKILVLQATRLPLLPIPEALPALPPLADVLAQVAEKIQQSWITHGNAKHRTVVCHHGSLRLSPLLCAYFFRQALAAGKQVLLLTPTQQEAVAWQRRLSPLLGAYVYGDYGRKGNGDVKAAIWASIAKGESRVVVGTGSALGLPFTHLAQVWYTNAHQRSYHAGEHTWPWNVLHAGLMAAKLYGAKVVLATPTPSFAIYYQVKAGRYGYVAIPSAKPQTEVNIISTRSKQGLAPALYRSLTQALANKQQAIALHPRHGYAVYLLCRDCEWIPTCPQCRLSLTYYEEPAGLSCHFCHYNILPPHLCAGCKSTAIYYNQTGMAHLLALLKQHFPQARIGCLDQSMPQRPSAKARLYRAFAQKEWDILVGTPAMLKGLRYSHVGWIGFFSPEQIKRTPHFSATVQYVQQLTMVRLAAQASPHSTKVWIQTKAPTCAFLKHWHKEGHFSEGHLGEGYISLLDELLPQRKALGYPPYTRLCILTIAHPHLGNLQSAAQKIYAHLQPLLAYPITSFGLPKRDKNGFRVQAYLKMGLGQAPLDRLRREVKEVAHQLRKQLQYRSLITQLAIDVL